MNLSVSLCKLALVAKLAHTLVIIADIILAIFDQSILYNNLHYYLQRAAQLSESKRIPLRLNCAHSV